MNTHNLCCIGHITLDKIVTPKRTLHMPGGTSFYFAHGMSKLDTSDFLLVTALAAVSYTHLTLPTELEV